ncbi:MAG TPA: MarR family transcriptional regulator [Mycobacteriales bacterium]|nr:MarR family transcriptional regulator [Mycobacteriales bacterium]
MAAAAPEVDLLALDKQVCFALSVASRTVIAIYRPILEPMGLTHPQYLVMLALWEEHPRSAKDLAAALHFDPATLSPLLKRLEAIGYVERARHTEDERVLVVDLTKAGVALRKRALDVPVQVIARLGMSIPELEAIRDGLTRLIDAATG